MAYFVQLERSSSYILIKWIKHALAHSFEFLQSSTEFLQYLKGDMESIFIELALRESKIDWARTDNVYFNI